MLAALAVWTIRRVAAIQGTRFDGVLTAGLFGLWVLYFWQILVVAFEVPRVLLPAPALIAQSILDNGAKLWGDFEQTVLKAVLIGGTVGSALGFAVAVAIDRSPFLQRDVYKRQIPLSQSLLLSSYPRALAGVAMALWSMTTLVAPVLGPLLGGWLTDHLSLYHF